MGKRSSSFKRSTGKRRYKRRYLLVCEGEVTEPDYFNQIKGLYREFIIDIACLKKRHSDPKSLIKRANQEKSKLRKGDELWILVDVDEWTEDQFSDLEEWLNPTKGYHVAVSKPCFEIWLVFHEKDLKDLSKKSCQTYFEENIARGEKGIRINWLTADKVKNAVKRAKSRDVAQQGIIPRTPTSRVYRLIERIEAFCRK